MRIAKEVRKKVREHINLGFADALAAAFCDEFGGREIESSFNIFEMALVSRPVDGGDFTVEQKAFVKAFELGYVAAMDCLVRKGY